MISMFEEIVKLFHQRLEWHLIIIVARLIVIICVSSQNFTTDAPSSQRQHNRLETIRDHGFGIMGWEDPWRNVFSLVL